MALLAVRSTSTPAPSRVTCAVLIASDTRTAQSDRSGPIVRRLLEEGGHVVAAHRIVPDDPERITYSVRAWADDTTIDAVIVSGGTGLAPRDNTYEAVSQLFTARIEGFGELFRMLSYEAIGSAAMLSRAVAGLIGTTVLFALPGSPSACELALAKLVVPELGHAVSLANPHKWRR
jgi:molybdenum cofactor biosynthesis protein B